MRTHKIDIATHKQITLKETGCLRLLGVFWSVILVATIIKVPFALNLTTSTETVVKVESSLVELGNAAGDPIPIPETQFTVTVKIYNVTSLYGFDLKFRWNTTFLAYISHSVRVPKDTYLDGVLWDPILQLADEVNASAGTYWIAYASMYPAPSFNGTSTVFIMAFEVINQPYDHETGGPNVDPIDTILDFSSTDLAAEGGDPIPHSVESATIRIWEKLSQISSAISITTSPLIINFGENTTIRGSISPSRSANVTLLYKLQGEAVWKNLIEIPTDPEGKYAYTWTPSQAAVYELNATWPGDINTFPASQTGTLTVNKAVPTITINVYPTQVTLGSNVTINGTISLTTPGINFNITIQCRLQEDVEWTQLATVQTDTLGQYTHLWRPDKAGIYEIRVIWSGDQNTHQTESEHKTVEVEAQPTEMVPYIATGIVTAAIIVAVAIYLAKIRKPHK